MATKHDHNSQSTDSYRGALAAAATPVAVIYFGPHNCELLIGHKPRWAKETAIKLGVPVLKPPGSSKWLIPAAQFMAALEKAGHVREPELPIVPEAGSADELAAMRARIGVRRTGGAR